MEIFEAKVYQCGKCWGVFYGVVNEKTKPRTVIYTHTSEVKCEDMGVSFVERVQLATVRSEKEEAAGIAAASSSL